MNKNYIFFLFFLVGCASQIQDDNFLKGVGKKSITHVNNMLENGQLGSVENTKNFSFDMIQVRDKGVCKRSNEQTLLLWIPPYEDNFGNLHGDQNIHVVVKESKWVDQDVS